MLCFRACWEQKRCGEHSKKDNTLWFCLPDETSAVLNDLAAVHLCALLGCRHEHVTKVQIMIWLHLDMLQRCENVVWEFRNLNCLFEFCILFCYIPFIVVSYSFLVYVPGSIKSVWMRQGDVQISFKNS